MLNGRRVQIQSGAERFSLHFENGWVDFESPGPADDVLFGATRSTILALADGQTTLERALDEGAIELRGTVEHVLDFYEGLLMFAGGAVRCPNFPHLLLEFRSSSVQSTDPEGVQ